MKKLGPSFGTEVHEAGLGGLPFSWNDEGEVFGRDDLTPEQRSKLNQIIADHDPEKPGPWQPTTENLVAEIEDLKKRIEALESKKRK